MNNVPRNQFYNFAKFNVHVDITMFAKFNVHVCFTMFVKFNLFKLICTCNVASATDLQHLLPFVIVGGGGGGGGC